MVSDSRQLIIDKYGAFLGKHSERLKVYLKGVVVEEKPFSEFEHLIIASGGITLSSDVTKDRRTRHPIRLSVGTRPMPN
jgi:hypothetical protein